MKTYPAPVRALQHRDFRLFASGQMISLVGTWMQMIAQSWLIYRLTGSATALGLATFFGQVPLLVLAPFGGLVADRIESKRLLLTTQTISMLLSAVLGTLTLLHLVHLWHVVLAAFLLGTVNAFDNPGRQVFVAEAVPAPDLMNGIALNSSMVNSARILGPSVAGVLVSFLGEGWCFILNAVSYLAVIAALAMMSRRPKTHHPGTASPLAQLKEGFAFAGSCLPIRRLLGILGLLSLMGTTYSVLMPIFADRILHGGPKALGLLMGTSGVGALAGAVSLAVRKHPKGLSSWVAGSSLLFGGSLLAFCFSRSLALSALLLVPVGYGFMVLMASTNTLLQMMVPDAFRGRVMSIHTVMFLGMAPLGGLLISGLSSFLSPAATVAVGGIGSLLGGLAFTAGLPTWRQEARKLLAANPARG